MYETILEFKQQVLIAKHRLLIVVRDWLKSATGLSKQQQEAWLSAFTAINSTELDEVIHDYALPLVRTYSINPISSSETEFNFSRSLTSVYKCKVANPEFPLNEIAALISLFDHLHQMERCLSFDLSFEFNSLELCHAVVKGMALEWNYVPEDQLIVKEYWERFAKASTNFLTTKETNNKALTLLVSRCEVQTTQLAAILKSYVSLLTSSFAMLEDSRYLTLFRSYLPWHAMLHQFAAFLFPQSNVIANKKVIEPVITKLTQLFNAENQECLMELDITHNKRCEAIQQDYDAMESRIQFMAESLAPDRDTNLREASSRFFSSQSTYLMPMRKEIEVFSEDGYHKEIITI